MNAGSGHIGACGLLGEPARKRSDQQWQRGRPTDVSSPDKARYQHGRTSYLVTDFQSALALTTPREVL
jgi:hypothetical protein